MEVRSAPFADVAELARGMKVVADEGRWIATEAGTPLEELEKRTRRRLAEGPVNLVLEEEGAIVGVADLHETQIEGGVCMRIIPKLFVIVLALILELVVLEFGSAFIRQKSWCHG